MIITNHPCCTVIRPGHVSQPYPTEQNMLLILSLNDILLSIYVKISLELLHS